MDYDADYEMDYEDDVYDDYEYDFAPAEYTLYSLYEDCLKPTLYDGVSSTFKLLLCCLMMMLTTSLNFLPDFVIHLTSCFSGIYCLHSFFGSDLIYVILFAALGYVTLRISNKILPRYQGVICVFFCFIFTIACELLVVEKTVWHKIRGSQMVLAMKLISLGFDAYINEIPDLIPSLGYLFNPGSVIFGPWISYTTYYNISCNAEMSIFWAFRIIQKLFLSFSFLTLSTCWTSWLLSSTQLKWIGAYRDALSFRSSHYFVTYLSEATLLASGMGYIPVVSSLDIEFPRSLVEVVINWNFPMHYWLKTYVFKTTKSLGNFAAVLMTYVASSLLHGLNFQLSAVLLSLGFYTYIEHVIRKKFAEAFDSCILARKCKSDCGHRYKSRNPYVIATNVAFSALAVFHLAYLGVMFDSSSSLEEEGYSMHHTLKKWFELDFASHWTAGAMYIINFLI